MNRRTKIYIAAAAAIIAIAIGHSAWTSIRMARLQRQVDETLKISSQKETEARDAESRSREYLGKIEYLESRLAETADKARRQDETIHKLNIDTRGARSSVERTRRTRSVDTTAAELCQKLAALAHGC